MNRKLSENSGRDGSVPCARRDEPKLNIFVICVNPCSLRPQG